MQKDWIYIIVGGLLEIFWALTMKLSIGFTQPFWSIITVILLLISFYIFAKGMENLPVGIAYTTYTGIGAIGTLLFGIFILHESVTIPKIGFSLLLFFGILLVKWNSKEE